MHSVLLFWVQLIKYVLAVVLWIGVELCSTLITDPAQSAALWAWLKRMTLHLCGDEGGPHE